MNQVLHLYAQLPVFFLMSSLIYGQISILLPTCLYMYKKAAQFIDWGILFSLTSLSSHEKIVASSIVGRIRKKCDGISQDIIAH